MEQIKTENILKLPFRLAICGVNELPETLARFSHIVSITDPDDAPLEFPAQTTVLRLAFHDVHTTTGLVGRRLSERDAGLPNVDHAEAILDFGRRLPDNAVVLVHCWAGVSRSTAAAYLLVAQAMPGDEQGAFDLIKSIRPHAQPNRLLVRYGDRLLGAEKRMVRCVDRDRD